MNISENNDAISHKAYLQLKIYVNKQDKSWKLFSVVIPAILVQKTNFRT